MQRTITVIMSESLVSIQGQALVLDLAPARDVHAIQWDGNKGHVEYSDGRGVLHFGEECHASLLGPYVSAWEAEMRRLTEEAGKPLPLEQARLAKLAEINNGYESVMKFIQSGYPEKETLTWERQAAQARALKENPEAEAVFVRVLAETKAVSVQEMADRIMRNAENWEPVAAMLTGERQVLEEAALEAQSHEELVAIHVGYTA